MGLEGQGAGQVKEGFLEEVALELSGRLRNALCSGAAPPTRMHAHTLCACVPVYVCGEKTNSNHFFAEPQE